MSIQVTQWSYELLLDPILFVLIIAQFVLLRRYDATRGTKIAYALFIVSVLLVVVYSIAFVLSDVPIQRLGIRAIAVVINLVMVRRIFNAIKTRDDIFPPLYLDEMTKMLVIMGVIVAVLMVIGFGVIPVPQF